MGKHGTGDESAAARAARLAAPIEASPCRRACPVGINVQAYVGLLAAGRPLDAAAVIRERNPLPHACGRLCSAPCERECLRGDGPGGPVAIRALKRFAVDAELSGAPAVGGSSWRPRDRERVAVVGAGPAGLTAAHDLARAGLSVTLLEAAPEPGGLLAAGVPAFRLPRERLAADVDAILALGVDLRTGVRIDLAAPDALLGDGYRAVILAVGSAPGPHPGIPGLPPGEALDAARLVAEAAGGGRPRLGRRVAVLAAPGAVVAGMAAARVARRCDAEHVVLVVSASRANLPLDEEDLAGAARDGVEVICEGSVIHAVRVEDGWALEVGEGGEGDFAQRTQRTQRVFDTVVVAAPRRVDVGGAALRCGPTGTVAVDPTTLETSVARVFAAGECSAGPRGVIEAMAAGRRAARSALRLVRGEDLRAAGDAMVRETLQAGVALPPRGNARWRPAAGAGGISSRLDEEDPGLTEPQAAAEARRCRMCGPCEECRTCTPTCDFVHVVAESGRGVDATRAPRGARGDAWTTAAVVDAGRCLACGLCAEVCPWAIPRLRAGKRPAAAVDAGMCRACGLCAGACPAEAIALPGWPIALGIAPAPEGGT